MPGPEIQANAISTALRGFPLNAVPGWINLVLIIGLGMLAPLAGLASPCAARSSSRSSRRRSSWSSAQWTFNHGWIVSFVYPFGTLVLSSVGALGAHYLLAAFERERVRDVFSRFVPEAVVDQVLARTDGDLRLGGVLARRARSMFTDLRGFTTFSEALRADAVIECSTATSAR